VFNMLTLRGIYGREMYETWYAMTVMLQSGLDISPVITHRFSHRDFDEAFDTAADGRAGKVLLDWTDTLRGRHREAVMDDRVRDQLAAELDALRDEGTYKASGS
jgi:hypothetical protein